MKVVITGGTGFIGRMLARAILDRGALTGRSGAQEEVDAIALFDAVGVDQKVRCGFEYAVSHVS